MNGHAANAEQVMNGNRLRPLGVVGGVDPPPLEGPQEKSKLFIWRVERGARKNYRLLGRHLALRRTDLFRNRTDCRGLLHVLADGTTRPIVTGAQLAPVIVDTLTMRVEKNGKTASELPAAAHLSAMLKCECFLGHFRPVDRVSRRPMYEDEFSLVPHGYHQNGHGKCLLYVGPEPCVADGIDTINRFLDVMAFAGPSDRTNTVGAALTVRLRHHWPGEKPLVTVTGNKSHSGKSTITDFVKGTVPKYPSILAEPLVTASS